MNKITRIAIIAVASIFVIGIVKNVAAKMVVQNGVKWVTGLELKVKSLKVGILTPVISIKELKLLNPKGYEERTMVDLPEVHVRYHLPAFFQGKVHLKELRLHLREFAVVKNQAGESNIEALNSISKKGEQTKPSKDKKQQDMNFQIDRFDLKLEQVSFKDYSKATPSEKTFDLRLNETFYDVRSPNKLVMLIVGKVLMSTTIGRFVNVDMGPLTDAVSDAAKRSKEVAAQYAAQAGEALKETTAQVADKTAAIREDVAKTAMKAGEALGEKTKGLIGGIKGKISAVTNE